MYIGPWQEFKLAKILQLKDKVEKEQEQEQRNFQAQQANQNYYAQGPGSDQASGISYRRMPQKAYSVGNGQRGGFSPQ